MKLNSKSFNAVRKVYILLFRVIFSLRMLITQHLRIKTNRKFQAKLGNQVKKYDLIL